VWRQAKEERRVHHAQKKAQAGAAQSEATHTGTTYASATPTRATHEESVQTQTSQRRQHTDTRIATTQIVYHYDGSLPGFYCCVYESFYLRELPAAILPESEAQPTLLPAKTIVTDNAKALRVRASIQDRISIAALELIETVFLSCLEQKELLTLRFMILAYREGGKALSMLGHPDVSPLLKA